MRVLFKGLFEKSTWVDEVRRSPQSTVVGGVISMILTTLAKYVGVPTLDALPWQLTGLGYILIFFGCLFGFALLRRLWVRNVPTGDTLSSTGTIRDKPQPDWVPMYDAALQAYEQTLRTNAADIARRQGGDDEIIIWYCWALWGKEARLRGKRSPSRVYEDIPLGIGEGFAFEVDNKKVVMRQRYGNGLFTEVEVMADDLKAVINHYRTLGA